MPKQVLEHRCLIISPGDVSAERDEIVDVIRRWNASVGTSRGIRIEAVGWETHSHPDMSGPPQETVNVQIVDDCDFGIALFWSRIGTPTAEQASGSVEEIDRLTQRGAKVMVYRSTKPIPTAQLDAVQWAQLEQLMDDYRGKGLLGQFSSTAELRETVNKDLSLLLLRQPTTAALDSADDIETAKRPDIRVQISPALAEVGGTVTSFVAITVENHSPRTFFLSSVALRLTTAHILWFRRDAILRTPNAPQEIASGNSYSFHVAPCDLGDVTVEDIICAEVRDKIGRSFVADPERTKRAFEVTIANNARKAGGA